MSTAAIAAGRTAPLPTYGQHGRANAAINDLTDFFRKNDPQGGSYPVNRLSQGEDTFKNLETFISRKQGQLTPALHAELKQLLGRFATETQNPGMYRGGVSSRLGRMGVDTTLQGNGSAPAGGAPVTPPPPRQRSSAPPGPNPANSTGSANQTSDSGPDPAILATGDPLTINGQVITLAILKNSLSSQITDANLKTQVNKADTWAALIGILEAMSENNIAKAIRDAVDTDTAARAAAARAAAAKPSEPSFSTAPPPEEAALDPTLVSGGGAGGGGDEIDDPFAGTGGVPIQ
jgi:hypothetical protein